MNSMCMDDFFVTYDPVYKLAHKYHEDDRPETMALWLSRPYRAWTVINDTMAIEFYDGDL